MKSFLKRTILYKVFRSLLAFYTQKFKPVQGINNRINVKGSTAKLTFDINGNNNEVSLEKGSLVENCLIYIRGNNHKVTIKAGVRFYQGEIWIEDNNGELFIGAGTTIQKAHFAVTENDRKIIIGDDCMFATNVEFRTGDSHSIINISDGKRINPAADIIVEEHVWVGSNVSVLKGVTLGKNCVVGTGSIVTKSVEAQTIAVGAPSKIIKSNISWLRDRI
jgi:acetyltransferase-like isoleucine patch superfamily enzyme